MSKALYKQSLSASKPHSWQFVFPPTIVLPRLDTGRRQILLGHTKIESTVRYLGIEVVNVLEMLNRPRSDYQSDLKRSLSRR